MKSKASKSKYIQAITTIFLTAVILLLLTACEQLKRDKSWLIASQSDAQAEVLPPPSTRFKPCGPASCRNGYHGRGHHTQWRGHYGWGQQRRGQWSRRYNFNPQTLETLQGEVTQVETLAPWQGMSSGIHLKLKTAQGNHVVHLGPDWYLEQQDIDLQPGDTIEVSGSRITFEGEPTVIAAQVTKGNTTLALRDQEGFPIWRGCRP